jgi:valyl-tRNA synthetase
VNYRFDDAANAIYQFFWGSFCDWYLEIVKLRLDFSETADKSATKAALTTLLSVFEASLRLLSPFMPFLTEEAWHAVYEEKPPAASIALTRYPTADAQQHDPKVIASMQALQQLIIEVRALRKELGVEEKAIVPIEVLLEPSIPEDVYKGTAIIERLARVSDVRFVDAITKGLATHVSSGFEVAVIYERTIDVPAERERLTKEIVKLEKKQAGEDRQLSNESYLAKAPQPVVEGLKKQAAETRLLLEKLRRDLENLPPG